MYCRNCGHQLPDDAKFCVNCGTEQSVVVKKEKRKGIPGFVLGIVACLAVFFVIGMFSGGDDKEEAPSSVETAAPVLQREEPTQPIPQTPENGWHEENGKRYYFSDGLMLTGMQEISNELYYFYEDGSLAVNTDVDVNGNILEAGSDGRVRGVVFEAIYGEWSSEKYRFGNNGTSSIMELSMEVENCDRMTFYIEANGLHGASVNGNWKIYVRSHGTWVFAKEAYYTEPSGRFEIRFDSPMDFDAITAYPTVQGNASYSSYYALYDVHMGL